MKNVEDDILCEGWICNRDIIYICTVRTVVRIRALRTLGIFCSRTGGLSESDFSARLHAF